MDKKKKTGFMMAEVIVVSAVILVVLGSLFISFNKIFSSYNTKATYYDSVNLFQMAFYRDIMIENDLINGVLDGLKTPSGVTKIYDSICDSKDPGYDDVIALSHCKDYVNLFTLPSDSRNYDYNDVVFIMYTPEKERSINSVSLQDYNVHSKFIDYVDYLKKSTTIKSNYLMLMERCHKENENNCKYGYLEVYDEGEEK